MSAQNLYGSFLLLVVAVWSSLQCVDAFTCPIVYPFDRCPRPGDPKDLSVCCEVDGSFGCCSGSEVFEWWVILLIILALMIIVGAMVGCSIVLIKKYKRKQAQKKTKENVQMS